MDWNIHARSLLRGWRGALHESDGSEAAGHLAHPNFEAMLKQFDTLHRDGVVTLAEFEHYYKVRACIELR